MAVRLVAQSVNHYQGASHDEKPRVGMVRYEDNVEITAKDLPAGSLFDEDDTGARWRWDGADWLLLESPEVRAILTVVARLETIAQEQRTQTDLFRDMLKPVEPEEGV